MLLTAQFYGEKQGHPDSCDFSVSVVLRLICRLEQTGGIEIMISVGFGFQCKFSK